MNEYKEPHYRCPVCNFKGLYEPAYDEMGIGSDDICPCCGFQFGLHNFDYASKEEAHNVWRKKWIDGGCTWRHPNYMPKNWNLEEQLKKINISLDDNKKL